MTEDILHKTSERSDRTSALQIQGDDAHGSPGNCQVDAIRFAPSGEFFLTGWIDDRASVLRHIRLIGRDWSRSVESRNVNRFRHADVDRSSAAGDTGLSGVWLTGSLDGGIPGDEAYTVEFALTDGSLKLREIRGAYCTAGEFEEYLATFAGQLVGADRGLPKKSAPLESQLTAAATGEPPTFPKYNVEAILVAEDGGVFVAGWIDDALDPLHEIRLTGSNWQVVFAGDALGRTRRDDVYKSLKSMRHHPFGFWGFASASSLPRGGDRCMIELATKAGARQRLEMSFGVLDRVELRNVILGYLSSCTYLGNPQLDSVDSVSRSIGKHVVDLNARITRATVAHPYVERFGRRRPSPKGSIIVCLYGKPEYLFLQAALFAGGEGIEDYEFLYVSNSPELAEQLLREARVCAMTFDVDLTLILLAGNAGFGAANNAAAKFARAERILIVNPDVFPYDKNWAAKHSSIVDNLPEKETRLFGAPLFYDDGSLMHSGLYFDADVGISFGASAFAQQTLLRVEHYAKGAPPTTAKFLASRPVLGVTGAFISCARDWFEKLGGFCEDYVFGHYEDADLCLRSLEGGVAPWIHDLKLWHLEGKGSVRPATLEGATTINRWLFNSLWGPKVIPGLIGQNPRHPLLQRAGDRPDAHHVEPRDRASGDHHPSKARGVAIARPHLAAQYKEIIFSAEESR
jgi:GT2 family glycosyltransferase